MIKQMELLESRQNVKLSLSGGDVPESEGPLAPSKPDTKKIYRCSEAGEHIQKSSSMRKLSGDMNGSVAKSRQMKNMDVAEREAHAATNTCEPLRTRSDVTACSLPVSEVESRARSDLQLSGVADFKKAGVTLTGHGDVDHYEVKVDPKAAEKKRRSVESLFPLKRSPVIAEANEKMVSGGDSGGRRLHQVDSGSSIHANSNFHEPGDDYFTPSECSLDSPTVNESDRDRLSHRLSDSILDEQVPRAGSAEDAKGKDEQKHVVCELLDEILDNVPQKRTGRSFRTAQDYSLGILSSKSGSQGHADIFQAMHEECVTAYKMIKNYRIRCAELESRLNDMISMGRRMIPLLNTAQYRNHQLANHANRTPVTYNNREMVYQLKGERSSLGLSDVIAASVVMMEESEHQTPGRPGNCGDTAGNHDADSEYEIWCVAVECDEPNCPSRESNTSVNATDDSTSNGIVVGDTLCKPEDSVVEEDIEDKNSVGIQVNLIENATEKSETKDTGVQANVMEERAANKSSTSRVRSEVRRRDLLRSTGHNLILGSKAHSGSTENSKTQAASTSYVKRENPPPDFSAGDTKMCPTSDVNTGLSDSHAGNKPPFTVESSSRCSSGVTKEAFFRGGKKDDVIFNQRSGSGRSMHKNSTSYRNRAMNQDRGQSSAASPIVQKSQPILPMSDSSKGGHVNNRSTTITTTTTTINNNNNNNINIINNDDRFKPAWDSSVSIVTSPSSSTDSRNGKGATKKSSTTTRSASANRRVPVERPNGKTTPTNRSTGSSNSPHSDGHSDDASSTSASTNPKPESHHHQDQGKGDRPNDC